MSKRALKALLEARGLLPSTEQLAVIDACMAFDALERWIGGAPDANSVADLLAL